MEDDEDEFEAAAAAGTEEAATEGDRLRFDMDACATRATSITDSGHEVGERRAEGQQVNPLGRSLQTTTQTKIARSERCRTQRQAIRD